MKNKKTKTLLILLMVILTTGCTKTLQNPETKKAVTNPTTGQSLTENVLCKPKDEETLKLYKEYKVDVEKLPECENFKVTSGGYEGLWNTIFVKPLAFIILQIGKFVNNYGLSIVITSLLIRLIAYPVTKKTAIQSELIKEAKPELDRLEKKYANKTDQQSMMKKSQEMTMIYKKYNINPISGCVYSMIQLPLFIAFLEAINRVPALFEGTFLTLQMGTSPYIAIAHGSYQYIILILLVGITTYFSFKLNSTSASTDQSNTMNKVMVIMILIMSIFMTSALNIYWITTNLFTIVQNLLVKKGGNKDEKLQVSRKN